MVSGYLEQEVDFIKIKAGSDSKPLQQQAQS